MSEASFASQRLATVRQRIAAAERAAGRPAGSVRLIAVSKTFDSDAIRPFLQAGHFGYGENRVQESEAKWPGLKAEFPAVRLDLVGVLQSNKAAAAVALFDTIQSVDRDKIAGALAKEIAAQGKRPELFVQVNIGSEPQKAGIPPREAVAFVDRCRGEHGLEIVGLMCIPPVDEPPGPHFALLAKLAHESGVTRLSMGMSADFETAIAFGSTEVRIGSALFGGR